MHLLLIEDDPQLGDGISAGLREAGHAVDWFTHGREGSRALQEHGHDLVILDLTLPDIGGDALLVRWRKYDVETPVLILTARDTPAARVAGLDAGADDYLVKPFEFDELCARIRALGRRCAMRNEPPMRRGDLVLDPIGRQARWKDVPVHLPGREFALLQLLFEQQGKVVSRRQIQQHLYALANDVGSNTVEVYVHNLRRLFSADIIRTVRGVGYIVDDDERRPGRS